MLKYLEKSKKRLKSKKYLEQKIVMMILTYPQDFMKIAIELLNLMMKSNRFGPTGLYSHLTETW